MSRRLRQASFQVVDGRSIVVPLIIVGLPDEIDALGTRWRRKHEFHLTVVPAAMLEAIRDQRPTVHPWKIATEALSGRVLGPIAVRDDLRRVTRDDDDLTTLVVMVDAARVDELYRDLSRALDTSLAPPPTHVTLYSSDPAEGIGIENETQLAERASPFADAERRALRERMRFDDVFGDDEQDAAPFTAAFVDALEYARDVHRGQRHRGREVPYLAHLMSVAALVAEDGGGEIEVVAALLHDAAEDHGGERQLSVIEQRFGRDVASIVRALSDTLDTPSGDEPWRARKQRYLAALRGESDPRILRVSNADKLHNARTLLAEQSLHGRQFWLRHPREREDELWYYGALARTFSERRPATSLLARELAETVARLAAG